MQAVAPNGLHAGEVLGSPVRVLSLMTRSLDNGDWRDEL